MAMMPNQERVLHGLNSCGFYDGIPNICEVTECPYRDDKCGCVHELAHDAGLLISELLKAQEPQVMNIGDLYGYDMGFYERRDEEIVWPVLISRGGPDDDETVGFVRKDGYELRSDCGLMNIAWRIWTAYPPQELREATPWE